MLERDFNILTIDGGDSELTLVPGVEPLVGVDRYSRRLMVRRYNNLSMVQLCEMLSQDLYICTKD